MPGTPSSISVPNTGPSAVETDQLQRPDGSVVSRQVVEIAEGIDLPNIRSLVEQMYMKYMYGDSIPLPDGRSVRFDEFGSLNINDSVSFSGGANVSRLIALGSTNATSVKVGTSQIYGWYIFNAAAATRFIKFYNVTKAPAVGTDIPVMTLPIPAGAAANVWASAGIGGFPLGLGYATTVNVADTDATAVTAGDIIMNLWYS